MCFSCEWCEEIKNRPLLADDWYTQEVKSAIIAISHKIVPEVVCFEKKFAYVKKMLYLCSRKGS